MALGKIGSFVKAMFYTLLNSYVSAVGRVLKENKHNKFYLLIFFLAYFLLVLCSQLCENLCSLRQDQV